MPTTVCISQTIQDRDKLESCGIRSDLLAWLKDFLTEHKL